MTIEISFCGMSGVRVVAAGQCCPRVIDGPGLL